MIPKAVMLRLLTDVRADAIARMKDQDQVATGRTIARLRVQAAEDFGGLFGPAHIDSLETGVRPSSKFTHPSRAHVESIRAWMIARGLTLTPLKRKNGEPRRKVTGIGPDGKRTYRDRTTADDQDSAAYGIARNLLLRGSRLHRGEDPRFSGTSSNTFGGLLTREYLGALRVKLGAAARPAIRSEILSTLKF